MSDLERRVDRLTEALLQLASELWSTRDRLMVLEEVLAQGGVDAATQVDDHVPSPALDGKLRTEREAFIGRLVAMLSQGASA